MPGAQPWSHAPLGPVAQPCYAVDISARCSHNGPPSLTRGLLATTGGCADFMSGQCTPRSVITPGAPRVRYEALRTPSPSFPLLFSRAESRISLRKHINHFPCLRIASNIGLSPAQPQSCIAGPMGPSIAFPSAGTTSQWLPSRKDSNLPP
jgi:hypothetical protein